MKFRSCFCRSSNHSHASNPTAQIVQNQTVPEAKIDWKAPEHRVKPTETPSSAEFRVEHILDPVSRRSSTSAIASGDEPLPLYSSSPNDDLLLTSSYEATPTQPRTSTPSPRTAGDSLSVPTISAGQHSGAANNAPASGSTVPDGNTADHNGRCTETASNLAASRSSTRRDQEKDADPARTSTQRVKKKKKSTTSAPPASAASSHARVVMVNSGNISNVSISECNNSTLNFSNGGNTKVNESKSGWTRPGKAGRRFECSRTKRKAVRRDGSDSDVLEDFDDAMGDFEDAIENMLDDLSSTSRRRTAESYQGYTPPAGQTFISPWGFWGLSNGIQSMDSYYHQYTQCAENIRQTMYAQQQSAQEQMRLAQEQAQWAREQASLARARASADAITPTAQRTGGSKPKKTKTETAKRTPLTTTPAPATCGPDCAGSYKQTTIDARGDVSIVNHHCSCRSKKTSHVQPLLVSGLDAGSRCPGYVEKEEVDERGGTKWVSRLCSHEECRRTELDPGVSSEPMKVETKLARRHRDKTAPRAKQQPSVENVTDEDA